MMPLWSWCAGPVCCLVAPGPLLRSHNTKGSSSSPPSSWLFEPLFKSELLQPLCFCLSHEALMRVDQWRGREGSREKPCFPIHNRLGMVMARSTAFNNNTTQQFFQGNSASEFGIRHAGFLFASFPPKFNVRHNGRI